MSNPVRVGIDGQRVYNYSSVQAQGLALGIAPFSAQAASWWLRTARGTTNPTLVQASGSYTYGGGTSGAGLALGFDPQKLNRTSWWLRKADAIRNPWRVLPDGSPSRNWDTGGVFGLALGFALWVNAIAYWWLRTVHSIGAPRAVDTPGPITSRSGDGTYGLALGLVSSKLD